MAAAILPPQNSLRNRFRRETLAQPYSAATSNPNGFSYAASGNRRRKRSPGGCRSGGGGSISQSMAVDSQPAAKKENLVMGQVRILKRGETLSSLQKEKRGVDQENIMRPTVMTTRRCLEDFDLVLGTTDRLGPDPETVQKQIGDCKRLEIVGGGYAGGVYSVSPPPSSLPVPRFLFKNKRFV